MTIERLKQKVSRYAEEGSVKLSPKPFKRLCELTAPSKTDPDAAQAERSIAAKLFAIIGTQGKTSAATALFKTKSQVAALEHVSWSDIEWYANHPARPSISSMYNNLGFPIHADVIQLELWVEGSSIQSERQKLLSSITGMQAGRGVPDAKKLDSLKGWCVENSSKDTWQELLSSITGMQAGRGVPDAKELVSLKAWCVENSSKDTWQELLSSITGMQAGRGVPEPSTLVKLKELYTLLLRPELQSWLINHLLKFPINERLVELRDKLREGGFSTSSFAQLHAALPPELCPGFTKKDLSTACVRLELPEQTVFLSSGHERVVAHLLHKYGLIKQFVEGDNLHVRTGTSHRIDLDFLLDEMNIFIEYHPLSQGDRSAGRSIEEAGARKIESVIGGKYHHYQVLHITELAELLQIVTQHTLIAPRVRRHLGETLSREQFKQDLKDAKSYGHEINKQMEKARALYPIESAAAGVPTDPTHPQSTFALYPLLRTP
jgi:hypothetical protein